MPVATPVRTPLPPPRLPAPSGPASEYGALRDRLLAGGGRSLKTLVFAGCSGGEGCTDVARGLAETLADSGLDVLLVDAGRQADGAGVLLAAGGCAGRLTVVPSPAAGPEPEHFFRSAEFASWLDVQRSTHDYVLVDAPPLLAFADATLMGRLCDGLVIVVEAEATERGTLLRARDLLGRAGVKVLGVVLNRARSPIPEVLRRYLPGE